MCSDSINTMLMYLYLGGNKEPTLKCVFLKKTGVPFFFFLFTIITAATPKMCFCSSDSVSTRETRAATGADDYIMNVLQESLKLPVRGQ